MVVIQSSFHFTDLFPLIWRSETNKPHTSSLSFIKMHWNHWIWAKKSKNTHMHPSIPSAALLAFAMLSTAEIERRIKHYSTQSPREASPSFSSRMLRQSKQWAVKRWTCPAQTPLQRRLFHLKCCQRIIKNLVISLEFRWKKHKLRLPVANDRYFLKYIATLTMACWTVWKN